MFNIGESNNMWKHPKADGQSLKRGKVWFD